MRDVFSSLLTLVGDIEPIRKHGSELAHSLRCLTTVKASIIMARNQHNALQRYIDRSDSIEAIVRYRSMQNQLKRNMISAVRLCVVDG